LPDAVSSEAVPSAFTTNRIAKQGLAQNKQASLIPGIGQKKVANLLDLSVILVTLGTPRIQGKNGRWAVRPFFVYGADSPWI
jgi:hypothetical protein